ncbi:hypothetical protein BH09VER1_BH09VER1_42950 [soil metagenome]
MRREWEMPAPRSFRVLSSLVFFLTVVFGLTARAAKPDRPRLWVSPPDLSNPATIELHPGENLIDLQNDAPGRDYVVKFPSPKSGHVTRLQIDGRSRARNIVIIGGTIEVPEPAEPLSMRFGIGTPTGGTWRIKAFEKDKTAPFSPPLPFDASSALIRDALDNLVGGPGHIASVTGEKGGPWTVTLTRDDPTVGRITADLSGLTGSAVWTRTTEMPGSLGLICKNFKGTVFLEGLYITGAGLGEGINVMAPFDKSQHIIQSCRVEPSYDRYHNDHHHPDALQVYNGPARLIMDRVDLITRGSGQCLMAQPREGNKPVALEALYDWYMRNVFFGGYLAPVSGLGPAWPIIREDDYPRNTINELPSWLWQGDDKQPCYTFREGTSDYKKGIASGPGWMYWKHPNSAPSWLHQNELPPGGGFADPSRGECGDDYVSPGYEGPAPNWGSERLAEAEKSKTLSQP